MLDLRDELESLRHENARLRKLLRLTDAEAAPVRGSQTAWFDGPVDAYSPPQVKVAFFGSLFAARTDVYAIRWESHRTGKSGWIPAVEGGWRKGRKDQRYLPLTPDVVTAHLMGDKHIGLYPMLPGDLTRWLAADFDGQAAMLDALAYLKAARATGAPAVLEVSRSGVGAHVWTFFSEPVAAVTARALGTAFVREAIAIRGRMDLKAYDRLFPTQDVLPARGLGNLIAAPLNGRCRKRGATVFLDLSTLEPYEDQWEFLSSIDRMTPGRVESLARTLHAPTVGTKVTKVRRATSTRLQPTPAPTVHVTLEGRIRIPGDDLNPALYSTLRHAASVYNPEFYQRQRRRQSTWNVPRIITCYDETIDDQLVLPRGLLGLVQDVVQGSGSVVAIEDLRSDGQGADLHFSAELSTIQTAALNDVLPHDLGMLVAPPGSGKTVMAAAVIAERRRSTLVLVDRKALAEQWRRQIQDLLGVKPGQLGGGRSRLTGVVDVVTLQTLARRTDLAEKLNQYGFVVVDECHHIPAAAFDAAVRTIPARFWLGLTATPYRRDGLDDLIAFQLGPVRHTLAQSEAGTLDGAQLPQPMLVVHSTQFRIDNEIDFDVPGAIAGVHRELAQDRQRNTQIAEDVMEAHRRGRNCLVLVQRTAHVDELAQMLAELKPVVLRGGMTVRQRTAAMARLDERPLTVVATGSFVGEGFDCPALDTLFLAGPVSFKGRLVQYAGRILRVYPGKTTAEVHDYCDVDVPVLAASLAKRAPGYVSLGFPDPRKISRR